MSAQRDILSDFLGNMALDGWGGLQISEGDLAAMRREQVAGAEEEARRQAKIARAALDNPAGHAFLELLIRKTMFRPESPEERAAATAPGPDAAARYALLKAQRAGQNNLVFMILAMLAEGRGEEQQAGGDL